MGGKIFKLTALVRRKGENSGFTLIELLVIIAILALLAILVLFVTRRQLSKGYDARKKADLDRIKIALEEYEKDHNCYPTSDITYCNIPPLNGTGLQPYLNQIPCDPVTDSSYYYEYDISGVCPAWYRVYTKLDNPDDPDIKPFCGPYDAFNYYVESPNAPACTPSGTGGSGSGVGGGPTPTPSGAPSGFWGCFNGVCTPIQWDPARPGLECDPHYPVDWCYGACLDNGLPANPCTNWQQ